MIPSGILEWLVTAAITCLFIIIWYSVRRFIEGQDQMNRTLVTISDKIGDVMTRVTRLETHVQMRDRSDDERHRQNIGSIREIKAELKERRS